MTGNEGEPPRPRFDTATGRRIVGYDAQTGAPVLEAPPSPPSRLALLRDKKKLLAAIGVCAILLIISRLVNSGGGGGHQLSGVVQGNMVGAGNIGGSENLTWSNVFCGWEGDHVEVHATLTDGLAPDPVQKVVEDVTISPIYTILLSDGSEQRHGDGFGSTLDVNVPAGKTVSWWGDAGQPEGIKQGAPIGSCVPEVMDVTH
jgi:hypothetical protein